MADQIYSVVDDSCFLALLDPDVYVSFVDEDWQLKQLFDHFRQQMQAKHLLIWGTGMEKEWRVEVRLEPAPANGFREARGTITTSYGKLLLTSYEGLTMAAQFEDVSLPEPHEFNQMFTVEAGSYDCRVVQLHDHEYSEEKDQQISKAVSHYVIELRKSEVVWEVWKQVPWADPAL